MSLSLVVNSILLGIGLAMDAFSVSIANGLNDPHMSKKRMILIAGTYGFFQWLMPTVGWYCVRTVASYFKAFQKWIPWIALILLLYIGGKMVMEGIRNRNLSDQDLEEKVPYRLGFGALFLQGIATSIDALSVGFTIAHYNAVQAVGSAVIIAVTTFAICMGGLTFGRRFGEKLADKASVVGGLILIAIGIEIFIQGIV